MISLPNRHRVGLGVGEHTATGNELRGNGKMKGTCHLNASPAQLGGDRKWGQTQLAGR